MIEETILVDGIDVHCELDMFVCDGKVWFEAEIGNHSVLNYDDSITGILNWYEELKARAFWGPVDGRCLFSSKEDFRSALVISIMNREA